MGSLTKQSGSHAVFHILHFFWSFSGSSICPREFDNVRAWTLKPVPVWIRIDGQKAHKKLPMWQISERAGLVGLPKSRPYAKYPQVPDLAPRTGFEQRAPQTVHLPEVLDPAPFWGRRREAGTTPRSPVSCRLPAFSFSCPHLLCSLFLIWPFRSRWAPSGFG